jgi:hypothetical protein
MEQLNTDLVIDKKTEAKGKEKDSSSQSVLKTFSAVQPIKYPWLTL